MNIEEELVKWMKEHETDMFELLREESERFKALHPESEPFDTKMNALDMANRRFIARAIDRVLGPLVLPR